MAEQNMEMGKTIYESLCTVLDNMGIKNYKKFEEDLVIMFGHSGKDMPHELLLAVNVKQEVVHIIEKLPFSISPERATDVACAVCYVNEHLLSGKFVYNMRERLSYEVTQIYTGSLIGEETLARMILALVFTVEDYDDKFMALNNGYLKPEDFKGGE